MITTLDIITAFLAGLALGISLASFLCYIMFLRYNRMKKHNMDTLNLKQNGKNTFKSQMEPYFLPVFDGTNSSRFDYQMIKLRRLFQNDPQLHEKCIQVHQPHSPKMQTESATCHVDVHHPEISNSDYIEMVGTNSAQDFICNLDDLPSSPTFFSENDYIEPTV